MSSVRHTIAELLAKGDSEILGEVTSLYAQYGFRSLETKAVQAWERQLNILRSSLSLLCDAHPVAAGWTVLLEYSIPLRDRRPDVVILTSNAVLVLEFKVGANVFSAADVWQVQSYALDLRDFHPGCADRDILPILVATDANPSDCVTGLVRTTLRGQTFAVHKANAANLADCLIDLASHIGTPASETIDPVAWERASYHPTPTIIEAAQALFAGNSVADISHAFSNTLESTSDALVAAIRSSERDGVRTICFVTGIPGSGKTLTGLNAVHRPASGATKECSAVFLSGNGPLVKVIREALARDRAAKSQNVTKADARDVASAFVLNVHSFIKMFGIDDSKAIPQQHAIVFDEAQRAWSAKAVKHKHGRQQSEPEMILEIMERVPGWATIIALVGGGQEIHNGEAGLEEWGRALATHASAWRVIGSPEIIAGGQSVAGHKLFDADPPNGLNFTPADNLHLRVNVRSHRAEFIGKWVNNLIAGREVDQPVSLNSNEFPVALTRHLATARQWLAERSESHQRTGLLASSGGLRLRAHGLEVSSAFRKGVSYADWFLNAPGDVRASFQLEVAATEFECQGLEIDWAGVCWSGDFVASSDGPGWEFWNFRGNKWLRVKDATLKRYAANKYRVLLTRARRGMVIWIPTSTATAKNPASLDATAERLIRAGVMPLD